MKSFINKMKAIWAIIRAKHFYAACSSMKIVGNELQVYCYYYGTIDFLHIASQAAEDNMNDLIDEETAVDAAYNIINPN